MPKFNLDEDKSLFSPLEFIIDGKKFIVSNLSEKMTNKASEMSTLSEQFAIFTGTDSKETENLNVMKLAKAIRIIMESIGKPFDIEIGEIGSPKKKTPEEEKDQEKNVSRPGQKK